MFLLIMVMLNRLQYIKRVRELLWRMLFVLLGAQRYGAPGTQDKGVRGADGVPAIPRPADGLVEDRPRFGAELMKYLASEEYQ